MYIYADESGHSGKFIFNEPTLYYQGAILSLVDLDPILITTVQKFKAKYRVERLHASELKQFIVERIALSFLKDLKKYNWEFHLTIIEKPYLSVTKFVDSLFDSYENKGARWLWYNHEFFRHTLCLLFDDVLSIDKKTDFWNAYLRDDHETICKIAEWVLDQLKLITLDKRLKEVASDGLTFAIENPEEIPLMASKTKNSYKGHTPNMVAFVSLINAINNFAKDNKVAPKTFIHDSQSEFGSTMREYHKLFSKVRAIKNESGLMLKAEKVEYEPANFSIALSRDNICIQACDIFLWLSQRYDQVRDPYLKKVLFDKSNQFFISRACSEMIINSWIPKLNYAELTENQIKSGKEIVEKMEKKYIMNREEFDRQKKN